MTANNESLDPFLRSLFLHDKNRPTNDCTPLDVLNQLLKSSVLSTAAIQLAYDSVVGSRSNNISAPNSSSSSKKSKKKKAKKEKPKKPNKPKRQYRYRHVALRLYYDGAEYSGLAQNVGRDSDQSVERELFQALVKTRLVESRETSGYSRCGRTDRGVSAAGQVIALRLKSNIPLEAQLEKKGSSVPVEATDLPKNESESIRICVPSKDDGSLVCKDVIEYPYTKMLNNVLPDSIRILGWSPVSDDFSARFSATTRTYRYFFVRRRLQLDKMRKALQLMVGTHDFRNFCKMDVEKVYNFERTIHSAELVECSQGVCYLQIHGQAFLWHQIRCIASILFLIGQGLEEPSVVTELLNVEKHPGKPSYPLAADRPLVLHDCGYPNLQMGYSAPNLWLTSCQLERQWEDLVLAAARIRNCLQTMRGAIVVRRDVVVFTRNKLKERIKKRSKHSTMADLSKIDLEDMEDALCTNTSVSWGEALDWMSRMECFLDPDGAVERAHIPLLERSRGTTYEEKIEALSKSKRRQEKYEENVIKKRKTAQEDAAFYEHKIKQGGTGI